MNHLLAFEWRQDYTHVLKNGCQSFEVCDMVSMGCLKYLVCEKQCPIYLGLDLPLSLHLQTAQLTDDCESG